MSEHFEYRFVPTAPTDMKQLETAGAEGWEAVGIALVDDTLLILVKRNARTETHKASLEASKRHLEAQLAEVDHALSGFTGEGWLPTHPGP